MLQKAGHIVSVVVEADTVVIARQCADARYLSSNSVRPSVRPFVRNAPVSAENGLTYCHSFFTLR